MYVIAQVSDTHFDGGARNYQRAAAVMSFLTQLPRRPDAIIVTGDIADLGTKAEYAQACEVLGGEIPVPILVGPGNHDDRREFRASLLGEEPDLSPINQELRIGNVTVAMIDSSVPGQPHGELDDATLRWARSLLDTLEPDGRMLLAVHHPPVELFSPIVDPIRLRDTDGLAELIRGDDRIVGAICGHAHTTAVTTFAGKPLVVAPAVSSVLGPVWESGENGPPVVDYDPPPAVAIHILDGDRFVTHFRVVA